MKKRLLCKLLVVCLAVVLALPILASCTVKYDLVYANWNLGTEELNNIERRMIKEFEKEHKVKIRIEDAIGTDLNYDPSLEALAGKGKLPDVFMLSNLPFGLEREYCLDITSMAQADSEWSNLPKGFEEASHYGKGIYAVPFAMFMMGFFANQDLFDVQNIKQLDVAPTYAEFETAVKAFKGKSNVIGLTDETAIYEWYPAMKKNDFGWFTWDGAKYNLDSPEFAEGLDKTKQMYEGKFSFDSLNTTEREAMGDDGTGAIGMWDKGNIGLRWGKTYESTDMLSKGDFNMKFIGVPGGRVPLIGDYLGISKNCANPQLAYDFAKYMSFGKAGILKRMELDKSGDEFNTLPMSSDKEVVTKYFEKYNNAANGSRLTGVKEAYELCMEKGIVEAVKTVPGYVLSRWNTKVKPLTVSYIDSDNLSQTIENPTVGKLIDLCYRNGLTFADYKVAINKASNAAYIRNSETLRQLYGIV